MSKSAVGPTLFNRYRGFSFGLKQPEREANRRPLQTLRMRGAIPPLPHMASWRTHWQVCLFCSKVSKLMERDTSVYFSHYILVNSKFKWQYGDFCAVSSLNLIGALLLIYPHFQPIHEFISTTVHSVLLFTLCLYTQLNERIRDWYTNTINCVSRSKFITQRACQLRNGIISERSAKVTLITKITHSYTIIVCNALTEYCVALPQIWACPRANTTGAYVLALCLLSIHPHDNE